MICINCFAILLTLRSYRKKHVLPQEISLLATFHYAPHPSLNWDRSIALLATMRHNCPFTRKFKGSLLTVSPTQKSHKLSRSTHKPESEPSGALHVYNGWGEGNVYELFFFFLRCVSEVGVGQAECCVRHSSQSIAPRTTGNTRADPSSKSRLPTL